MMTRKLDAAIAEALGNQVEWVGGEPKMRYKLNGAWWINYVLDYSSCGNAMLVLDAEMRGRGYRRIIFADSEVFSVRYFGSKVSMGSCFVKEGKATSAAMPEAVALAAYKALTGKEWQDD